MSHTNHEIQAPSNIRVTHLLKGLGPGGAERLVVNQLLTSGGGFDYSVLRLLEYKDHLESDVLATGASVKIIRQTAASQRVGVDPLALAQALRALKPDIIHAHSPILAAQARLLTRLGVVRAKTVTTEHNRWPRHHRATRMANRITAPLDAARFAVSKDVLQSMDQRLATSTVALEHGLPLDEIRSATSERQQVRDELDLAADTIVIGIVANFRPEKSYDVFLEAAQSAVVKNPKIHFVVIGQGPGEQAFRESVARSTHPDSITVLGYRRDAVRVMSAFDIFTLTSRHEGKPVSLMEAMALGLPIVATRAGGIPEMVSGNNGRLVAVGDSNELAESYLELSVDHALRVRLGESSLEASDRFDASRSTKSIESAYRDLTSTTR